MNLIKQVFNEVKIEFRKSFLIGSLTLATMYICNLIPVISAYLMGICFLIFAFTYYLSVHKKENLSLQKFKSVSVPIALGAAFLIPSVFMMGTGMSLVNNSSSNFSMASLGLVLFLFSIYFLVCSYVALIITTTENKNFLKSLDDAFKLSTKKFVAYFWICFGFASAFALASFLFYVGMAVLFPLFFSAICILLDSKIKETSN